MAKNNNEIPLNKWLVLSDGSFVCLTAKTSDDLYFWHGFSKDDRFISSGLFPTMFSIDEFSGEAFGEKIKELLVLEWKYRMSLVPDLIKCLFKYPYPRENNLIPLPWGSHTPTGFKFNSSKNSLCVNGYVVFIGGVWAELIDGTKEIEKEEFNDKMEPPRVPLYVCGRGEIGISAGKLYVPEELNAICFSRLPKAFPIGKDILNEKGIESSDKTFVAFENLDSLEVLQKAINTIRKNLNK